MIHHYFYLEALTNKKKITTKNTSVVVVDFSLKEGSGARHFVEEKLT